MERKLSLSVGRRKDQPREHPLPPWELSTTAAVPFFDAGASPLSLAERDGLPSLWAAKDNGTPASPPTKHSPETPSVSYSLSPVSANDQAVSPWSPTYMTPEGVPIYMSPGVTTSSTVPAWVLVPVHETISSPTPPEEAAKPTPGNDESSEVKALPGTMSTAPKQQHTRRRRPRSLNGGDEAQWHGRPRRLSRRIKGTLKELFRKDQVDDAMFERIEDHHWTEE